MNKEKLKSYYNEINSYNADYKELFYEETNSTIYSYVNKRIDDISYNEINGLGITLNKGNFSHYICTNNLNEINLLLNNLENYFTKDETKKIDIEEINYDKFYNHDKKEKNDIKNLFNFIDDTARKYDSKINQVKINLIEKVQNITVINNNILSTEKRILTRIAITVMAKNEKEISNASYAPGFSSDYTAIDEIDIKKEVENICKEAIEKLSCTSFKGGKMPAVIGPGFGAVIFHEACGHAMESYSITDKTSIFTNKLNKQIASEKVTIIDDGTINNLYGTTDIDDQGTKTKKNILIKKGVLVNYLTDLMDAKKLNSKSTGSARRENYKYFATSRMNNTYLEKGNDNIKDMIKSIKYGIYAKNLGGGSVSPNTGEFNFVVNFGYIIKDGKIDKPIKNISLIGNAEEILQNVDMVSDDISFGTGMCGAMSGSIPVTIGQPTIKVTEILVGGNTNE